MSEQWITTLTFVAVAMLAWVARALYAVVDPEQPPFRWSVFGAGLMLSIVSALLVLLVMGMPAKVPGYTGLGFAALGWSGGKLLESLAAHGVGVFEAMIDSMRGPKSKK